MTNLESSVDADCRDEAGNKKAGEDALSGFFGTITAMRLLPLQLEDFVLDAEFLALQIVDRLLVGKGTMDLFIDGAFEGSMLFSERLDAIVQRHAVSSCLAIIGANDNAGSASRPEGASLSSR